MYTALIITKNYLKGVTRAGEQVTTARVGNVEVKTISNLALENFGYQLSAKDILDKTGRKLEEYGLVVVYVGERTPRLPVAVHVLSSVGISELIFVMAAGIKEEDYPDVLHVLNPENLDFGMFKIIGAPPGDENGTEAILAIRAGLLEFGESFSPKEGWNKFKSVTK